MSPESSDPVSEKVFAALKEPDRFVRETFETVRESVDRRVSEAESFVRAEPGKAMAIAGLAGFAMRILPVGRIVGTLAHITFSLLKPAVLVYGGAKVWQKISGGSSSEAASDGGENPGLRRKSR